MEKIIAFFKIDWVHQLIGAISLLSGVVLGAIIVCILWKNFTLRDKDKNKQIKDVEYIKENAVSTFLNGKSSLEIKKLSCLCESLTYMLEKIPAEYGNSKAYDVIAKENFKIKDKEVLLSNLSLHLDFTVYELLVFINVLAEQLRSEVYSIINSEKGKFLWAVGKVALKNKMQVEDRQRELDEITIESFRQIVLKLIEKQEPNEEEQESKVTGFFKSIIGKVKEVAGKVAKPIGNAYLDGCIIEIIKIFAEELNNLYSGQFKNKSVKSVSQSTVEEGV